MREYKLILASASPRRSVLLKKAGFEFDVIPSNYEEKLSDSNFSYEKIENLAYQKALNVLKTHTEIRNSFILGADTVVVLDNKILGKPKDKNNALEMLKILSGKTHFVVTAICLIDSNTKKKVVKSTTSSVSFKDLSEEKILSYIEKYNPMDKAGSYGIQELPPDFIEKVEGSFENIVGLCPNVVSELLSAALSEEKELF